MSMPASPIFLEAAQVWEDLDLPCFSVRGYFDGRIREWESPAELLRFTAQLCKQQGVFVKDAVTRRRLRDGHRAKTYLSASDDDLEALKEEYEVLITGGCALQSLDDLGSREANAAAMADLGKIQKRMDDVKSKIAKLEGP